MVINLTIKHIIEKINPFNIIYYRGSIKQQRYDADVKKDKEKI